MPPRIFISYRRNDAAGDAGRLADHLNRRFGAGRVFLDIDTIEPGTDFERVLQTSLQETAAMLVVVGPHWASLSNADGTRRLDDPNDFVRREVEAALGRGIPVVPLLVQGAAMPRANELPTALAAFARRQAMTLDHAEFHADAERLCDRLETVVGSERPVQWRAARRWWPAAAAIGLAGFALTGYFLIGTVDGTTPAVVTNGSGDPAGLASTSTTTPSANGGSAVLSEEQRRAEALLGEASAQYRRRQFVEALATLARARELAPGSEAVRRTQEDVAMDWIRNARVEAGTSSFGEAIKPALAVIDASLASARGVRRADLLAHSGWASFLLWRDGNRQLNPAEWYRDALSLEPTNPYANAMLAHWVLFRDDDVPQAVKLFDTALKGGRARDAVRNLQWAGYGNTRSTESDVERVRVADGMRRDGQKLSMDQAQALWSPYYFALSASRDKDRAALLASVAPLEHISTLSWAFGDYAARDETRRQTLRYYTAMLRSLGGRSDQALEELMTLDRELSKSPGSLRDAVAAALKQMPRVGAALSGLAKTNFT